MDRGRLFAFGVLLAAVLCVFGQEKKRFNRNNFYPCYPPFRHAIDDPADNRWKYCKLYFHDNDDIAIDGFHKGAGIRNRFPSLAVFHVLCNKLGGKFSLLPKDEGGPGYTYSPTCEYETPEIVNYNKSCPSGWLGYFHGRDKFCFKAYKSGGSQETQLSGNDVCSEHYQKAKLVTIPDRETNMFIYVNLLSKEKQRNCSVSEDSVFYLIGLRRNGLHWMWQDNNKALEDAKDVARDVNNYYAAKWPDGSYIFAQRDGTGYKYNNEWAVTEFAVMSDCGYWKDVQPDWIENGKFSVKYGNTKLETGVICSLRIADVN